MNKRHFLVLLFACFFGAFLLIIISGCCFDLFIENALHGNKSYSEYTQSEGSLFWKEHNIYSGDLYSFVNSIEFIQNGKSIGWVSENDFPDGLDNIYYEVFIENDTGDVLFRWNFVFRLQNKDFFPGRVIEIGGDTGGANLHPFPDLERVSKGRVTVKDNFWVWIRVFVVDEDGNRYIAPIKRFWYSKT